MKLDNFTLTTFLTCPAKYEMNILQGWRPLQASAALDAGKVLHKGLEVWYKTGNLAAACMAVQEAWTADSFSEDFRSKQKVIATLVQYTERYQRESFEVVGAAHGNPMIEVAFTLPTGMFLDVCPECGQSNETVRVAAGAMTDCVLGGECAYCGSRLEELEYGGIFDLLVERQGMLYVVDHKTTTQFGPKYWYQYKPNNQISGYLWGASKLSGAKVGGAIINVIAWYKAQATKFERQITTRTTHEIDHWFANLRKVANLIQRANLSNSYPENTAACTLYGNCEYHRVHELATQGERDKMLSMNYHIKKWDHEARDVDAAPAKALPVIEG